MKADIKVNMDGETYLKYLESKKLKFPKLSKKTKNALPYFILALCGVLVSAGLINHLTYIPPEPVLWGYSNFWGVTVDNRLVWWGALSIGLAWIFHGFGFIIIRR